VLHVQLCDTALINSTELLSPLYLSLQAASYTVCPQQVVQHATERGTHCNSGLPLKLSTLALKPSIVYDDINARARQKVKYLRCLWLVHTYKHCRQTVSNKFHPSFVHVFKQSANKYPVFLVSCLIWKARYDVLKYGRVSKHAISLS
jgi:hypothetical protein